MGGDINQNMQLIT